MAFNEQFEGWDNQGTEPSTNLKENGFEGGYKPPASVFNWFWSKVMRAITELQNVVNSKADFQNSTGGFNAGAGSTTKGGTGVAIGANAGTADGGAVGNAAQATAGGGAIGNSAVTEYGLSGGYHATCSQGFAGGCNANATTGAAGGDTAKATTGAAMGDHAEAEQGGAAGYVASTKDGGAIGAGAKSNLGGAIGNGATTGDGFAGGNNAKAVDSTGIGIDAIQLGSGTNNTANTLQVYSYQLLDASGKIPTARIPSHASSTNEYGAASNTQYGHVKLVNNLTTSTANTGALDARQGYQLNSTKVDKQTSAGGFAAGGGTPTTTTGIAIGYNASSGFDGTAVGYNAIVNNGGVALGYNAKAGSGGAVGRGAVTSSGFAGGSSAKTQTTTGTAIDAIQLGTGTNSTAKTLQVYNYQLMGANGKIPAERLPDNIGGGAGEITSQGGFCAGTDANTANGGAIGNGAGTGAGGAVGAGANSMTGFSGGYTATTDCGGSIGEQSYSINGGAVGYLAKADNGGAIGNNAIAGAGFSGGYNARVSTGTGGTAIDAIQLGTGTNSTAKTLQVYTYQLMGADGKIPLERFPQEILDLLSN